NLGGWPTTAFLTPEGQILAGGTFVPVERMPGVLAQVADAFASRTHGAESDAPEAAVETRGDALSEGDLTARVFATVDELQRGVDAHLSRGRGGAADGPLHGTWRRHAALHPDVAGRPGGRRLARVSAG